MYNVFTYGSLMFDQVWQHVVSGNYLKANATLYGHARKAIKNEAYPALIESAVDSSVNGVVYKGVSFKDLVRLDKFEGEYYRRKTGQVVLQENVILTTVFYVLKPAYHTIISDREWDEEYFKSIGIKKFLDQYFGFRRIMD